MTRRRTIGQLAKEVGVGVETIRFYERKGLIDQPRSGDGPRHYDDATLAKLRYIRVAQQMGISLKDILALRPHLLEGSAFCNALRATVERKLVSVTEQIVELARLQGDLTAFLHRCRTRDPDLGCPILEELTRLGGMVSPRGQEPVTSATERD